MAKDKKSGNSPTAIKGVMYVYNDKNVTFNPKDTSENVVTGARRRGVLTMLSDGRMGFMAQPYKGSTTKKLKRTVHGTLSESEDNYYLYMRIDKTECSVFRKMMAKEMKELLTVNN
ncbi:MAG: hypothetical protein MR717_04360 [Prevotella sp.]|nr:hypothetical protein [Prevotella sp.]